MGDLQLLSKLKCNIYHFNTIYDGMPIYKNVLLGGVEGYLGRGNSNMDLSQFCQEALAIDNKAGMGTLADNFIAFAGGNCKCQATAINSC